MGNSKRRVLLAALVDGQGKAASQVAPLVGRTQDAAMKHLTEMREAGLVQMSRDPNDNRRQLYFLTPSVKVIPRESGVDLDFGCCVWRVR